MASFEFVTVDVFTETRFGGNPLGVVPDARGLTDLQMQAIAREFNLSETTFVLPPDNPMHHARVRIFTPATELPFAGHPNVGTGYVLATRDQAPLEHYVFEEVAGLVRVHILRERDKVTGARVAAPVPLRLGVTVPVGIVAACASLHEADIVVSHHDPIVASVGTEFVIAEVASPAALARAVPDIGAFRAGAAVVPGMQLRFALHLYTRAGDSLRARMFAPLGGVLEDPATGSANAALAALLTHLDPGADINRRFHVEQGIEMGRPSVIVAGGRKTQGAVTATVAGGCVPVMAGTLTV
ncbi:MAG: PhzF family phenazine biosynthesis protein [Acetobacteraceae bacterium]